MNTSACRSRTRPRSAAICGSDSSASCRCRFARSIIWTAKATRRPSAAAWASIIRRHPIDVAFVGIGENGHLAFNDPPADFETEEPYLVVELDDACRRQQLGEGWFPTFDDVPKQAISMSVRQIMKSRAIICTVPDERKAEAVRNAVEGEVTPQVPASILQRHEQCCTLYLDKPAASQLRQRNYSLATTSLPASDSGTALPSARRSGAAARRCRGGCPSDRRDRRTAGR